jgi:hypothetical protein
MTRNTILNGNSISYCTTCYNRFWQLKKVIKHNLGIINKYENVDWVIVDFGSKNSEEMKDWIVKNCPKSLKHGTLKFYQRKNDLEPFVWNVSVSKNVSHRLATGDILVNLDGDNKLQTNDPTIIKKHFTHTPKQVFHQTWNNFLVFQTMRSLGKENKAPYKAFKKTYSGSNGRITFRKEHFDKLGGYDEEMVFMGYQDTDLIA